MIRAALLASILLAAPTFAADPPKITLKDGDRIVYLGNTFAERDANYGYLETLLTIRHPDVNFTFRNLGWSGDTVWGDARARFGTRADGFKHLKEHVLALKPTIILVAYGMNESFAGEAGLKEFEAGLNALLDTLAETKAKIVLISPIPLENLGPPLPNPDKQNANIRLYRDLMAKAASTRELVLIDFFERYSEPIPTEKRPAGLRGLTLTEDGLHPDDYGYFRLDGTILFDLQIQPSDCLDLEFDREGAVKGNKVFGARKTDKGVQFQVTDDSLPEVCTPRADGRHGGHCVNIKGLSNGKYIILVDGKKVSPFEVEQQQFLTNVQYAKGPEVDQANKLRALINRKNELYFHRWRPQNETYLFGFRKHEQGNNAVEIPQFDPLIAELEAQINVLKKPVKHTYEIIREEPAK